MRVLDATDVSCLGPIKLDVYGMDRFTPTNIYF